MCRRLSEKSEAFSLPAMPPCDVEPAEVWASVNQLTSTPSVRDALLALAVGVLRALQTCSSQNSQDMLQKLVQANPSQHVCEDLAATFACFCPVQEAGSTAQNSTNYHGVCSTCTNHSNTSDCLRIRAAWKAWAFDQKEGARGQYLLRMRTQRQAEKTSTALVTIPWWSEAHQNRFLKEIKTCRRIKGLTLETNQHSQRTKRPIGEAMLGAKVPLTKRREKGARDL